MYACQCGYEEDSLPVAVALDVSSCVVAGSVVGVVVAPGVGVSTGSVVMAGVGVGVVSGVGVGVVSGGASGLFGSVGSHVG